MRRFFKRLPLRVLLLTLAVAVVYSFTDRFSRQWREFVMEQLEGRGVHIEFSHFGLHPIDGLVARDVRVFNDEGHQHVLMTIDRLNLRRSLLEQIDEERRRTELLQPASSFQRNQQQAFDILTSSKIRTAFDLSQENPKTVERYGQTLFGNSTLIARRLIEAGVRFVNVTWDLFWGPVNVDYDAWDTHQQNFKILKQNKLPGFDQTMSALMSDLETRGLLDETLIVVTSEMGRTPRVNANAGRDHWTNCYGSLLAGAGIKGGTVYGSSDSQASYVKDKPVRPADLVATIYRSLGIDPELRVPDHTKRPVEISQGGVPLTEVMA